MSPRARMTLPPELEHMTRQGMETVIREANIGREDTQIARLYYVDKLPQVDVATELYHACIALPTEDKTKEEGKE